MQCLHVLVPWHTSSTKSGLNFVLTVTKLEAADITKTTVKSHWVVGEACYLARPVTVKSGQRDDGDTARFPPQPDTTRQGWVCVWPQHAWLTAHVIWKAKLGLNIFLAGERASPSLTCLTKSKHQDKKDKTWASTFSLCSLGTSSTFDSPTPLQCSQGTQQQGRGSGFTHAKGLNAIFLPVRNKITVYDKTNLTWLAECSCIYSTQSFNSLILHHRLEVLQTVQLITVIILAQNWPSVHST